MIPPYLFPPGEFIALGWKRGPVMAEYRKMCFPIFGE